MLCSHVRKLRHVNTRTQNSESQHETYRCSSRRHVTFHPVNILLCAGLQFVAVARCCRSLHAVARCCQSLVLLLSAFFPLTGKCTGKVCSLGELCINYLLIPCISLSNFSQLELFAGLLLLVRNTFAAN